MMEITYYIFEAIAWINSHNGGNAITIFVTLIIAIVTGIYTLTKRKHNAKPAQNHQSVKTGSILGGHVNITQNNDRKPK